MTRKSTTNASVYVRLAILVEIAGSGGEKPVTTSRMATAAGLSMTYIEVACAWLRRRGLIKSFLGHYGGYMLTRPASDIFVADIIDAIGKGFGKYDGAPPMAANILDLWDQSESLLMQVYQHISLTDVLRGDLQAHPILRKLRDSCHPVQKQKPFENWRDAKADQMAIDIDTPLAT